MPKILDDMNIKILEEAKKQVFEKGYQHMTIRSVALACGIGVGTIYNYYASKEALIAAFILADWVPLYEELRRKCNACGSLIQACQIIYEGLLCFQDDYKVLFDHTEAIKTASEKMPTQHPMLRKQLAGLLLKTSNQVSKYKEQDKEFLPEFISEILLSWSIEEKSFSQIEPYLKAIIY